jgi:hypothetical protein
MMTFMLHRVASTLTRAARFAARPHVFARRATAALALVIAAAGVGLAAGCAARGVSGSDLVAGAWTDAQVEAMAREARAARPGVEQIEALIARGRAPRPARTGRSREAVIARIEERLSAITRAVCGWAAAEESPLDRPLSIRDYRPLMDARHLPNYESERGTPIGSRREQLDRLMAALSHQGVEDLLATLPSTDLPIAIAHRSLFGKDVPPKATPNYDVAQYALAVIRASVLTGDLTRFERACAAVTALLDLLADSAAGGDDSGSTDFVRLSTSMTEHMDFAARARPQAAWLAVVDKTLQRSPRWDDEQFLRWKELACLEYLCAFYSNPENIRRGWGARPRDANDTLDEAAKRASALSDIGEHTKRLQRVSFAEARAALNNDVDRARQRLGSLRLLLLPEASSSSGSQTLWSELARSNFDSSAFVSNSELSLRGVRVGVRVELFRSEHGRLPTKAEYEAMFASSEWAQDPFSGGLLGYRIARESASAARWSPFTIQGVEVRPREFVVYSVGVDGVDHGGKIPEHTGNIIGSVFPEDGNDVRMPLQLRW